MPLWAASGDEASDWSVADVSLFLFMGSRL